MPDSDLSTVVGEARQLERWPEFANRYLPDQAYAKRNFILFQARWRLAWSFESLGAPGYSGAVLDGYSTGFNLFLAYTAHEQLAKAVGRRHHEFAMEDAPLAADVRKRLSPLQRSLLNEASKPQAESMLAFFAAQSDDVRAVAYGIRNMVAHGPFAGSKLRSKVSRAVVASLAERILLLDEQWFGEWLDADGTRPPQRVP